MSLADSNDLPPEPLKLALGLAACGWHILPLAPGSKRPLANCHQCAGHQPHPIEQCPCIPAGRWCHGVRAATTDPGRLTSWWARCPHAIPGVAAGPSRLVLLDLDTHTDQPPHDPALQLLPGIDLTAEHLPPARLQAVRDGRDALLLLAELRGGADPWPTGREQQPVVVTTPSGGRHLWYRAPHDLQLRQALGELAWQVDIKAGHTYGIAPGVTTRAGCYTISAGDPAAPGHLPDWLTRELARTASRRSPAQPRSAPTPIHPPGSRPGPGAYLTTVIDNGAADLAHLTDGRQRALSALAYKTGGLLAWSGLPHDHVEHRLIDAGITSGLPERIARRTVTRALANGLSAPLPAPTPR